MLPTRVNDVLLWRWQTRDRLWCKKQIISRIEDSVRTNKKINFILNYTFLIYTTFQIITEHIQEKYKFKQIYQITSHI